MFNCTLLCKATPCYILCFHEFFLEYFMFLCVFQKFNHPTEKQNGRMIWWTRFWFDLYRELNIVKRFYNKIRFWCSNSIHYYVYKLKFWKKCRSIITQWIRIKIEFRFSTNDYFSDYAKSSNYSFLIPRQIFSEHAYWLNNNLHPRSHAPTLFLNREENMWSWWWWFGDETKISPIGHFKYCNSSSDQEKKNP